MYAIREKIVGEKTEERLKNHGLTLTVSEDKVSGHPLKDSDIVFVGGDTHRDYFLERFKGDMGAFVRAFCKNVLNCRADDLIWKAVYSKDVTERKNYTLEAATHIGSRGGYKEQGFIYITKEKVKESFSVGIVGTKIRKKIISEFEEKIVHLNAWNAGNVYRASVTTDEGGVYDTWHGLYTYKKSAESQINLLINEIINSIDTDNDICRFGLEIKVNEIALPLDITPTAYFIAHVKNNFGFTPALGAINHDHKTDILTTNMLANTMPLFNEIVTKDLFESMQKQTSALINDDRFESTTSSSIKEIMEAGEHYTTWPPLMIHALMTSIVEDLAGIEIVSAEIADYM
ncbi:MAG: hypothetical protein J6N72_09910 [Psychrobacter sp.]|nr:hypothetical protein [Psychrobacter sp.]